MAPTRSARRRPTQKETKDDDSTTEEEVTTPTPPRRRQASQGNFIFSWQGLALALLTLPVAALIIIKIDAPLLLHTLGLPGGRSPQDMASTIKDKLKNITADLESECPLFLNTKQRYSVMGGDKVTGIVKMSSTQELPIGQFSPIGKFINQPSIFPIVITMGARVLPRPVRSCSEIAEKYYDANIKDAHSGKTQKLSSYLKRNGGFCAVGQLDLPSHMDWTQLREQIVSKFGVTDVMINELQFGGTLLAPGTEMRPTLGEYCLTTVSIQMIGRSRVFITTPYNTATNETTHQYHDLEPGDMLIHHPGSVHYVQARGAECSMLYNLETGRIGKNPSLNVLVKEGDVVYDAEDLEKAYQMPGSLIESAYKDFITRCKDYAD